MPQIYGYARASTKKQEDSPTVQADKIVARATQLIEDDPTLSPLDPEEHIASEHKSADRISWEDRPAFQSLMRTIEEGDVLIVTHYDRLDRNPLRFIACLAELQRKKIRLILLNCDFMMLNKEFDLDDAQCVFLAFQWALFLKMWSDYNRQRLLDMNVWLKKQGRCRGRVPFGMVAYKKTDGKYYLRWDKQQCTYMLELYNRIQCGETFIEIGHDWHQRGLTRQRVPGGEPEPWVARNSRCDRNNPKWQPHAHRIKDAYKRAAKMIEEEGMVGCVPYDPTVGVEYACSATP
jgi:hypothetical protein